MTHLATLDWVLIGLYFAVILGVAWWVAGRKKATHESSTGYFLAGRNVGWFVVGAALFASNIGSEHLVGLAGTGYSSGVAVGQFEVLASLILLILGWLFVPFYLKSGVFTMPEFLERRYSSGARWYLAVISIVGYVLTKISVTLYAGGIVYEVLIGGSFWTGALIIVLATGLYTVIGGLRAVLYTEMLQMFMLVGGALLVTVIGLQELGGWTALTASVESSFFDMWLPATHPDFPWTGILFGAPILGVWYWCTDQFIVQRVLSANGIDQARRGTIFGGFLKILPLFIFVVPGIVAFALAQSGQLELARSDHALPEMIRVLLPVGLRGLVVAGFLAALMSSLAAVFNSCSTLITWDVYRKLRPDASEKSLVLVGKVATGVLVVFGLAWIPFMKYISDQLYVYLQSVQAYISPPIAAVFLIGLFWRRVNAQGAIASLATGFVLGMGRLVLELTKGSQSGFLFWYADINFLHFAIVLFLACTVVLVVVSLLTPAQSDQKLAGLTFATAEVPREDPDARLRRDAAGKVPESDPAWRRKDLWLSILLILCVGLVWAYFTGGSGAAPSASVPAPAVERPTVHPEQWPAVTSPVARDEETENAIGELMTRMSVEEKVGQVIQAEIRHATPEDVKRYHLGSVLNGGGSHPNQEKHSTVDDWVALADAFWEASMDTADGGNAIPIIWGVDAVHGHANVIGATIFPHNVGLGAANDPELLRRIGRVTAREVAATGLDWNFGPTVAVARDDRWGRTYESYSEDPDIVRAYAGKMVEGLQGAVGSDEWLDDRHVISTAKHFLGDGGTDTGKDQGVNLASEEELREIHGAGYVSALEAGVQTVMASFSSWHGEKMHGRKELLTDVLKSRMGFDGFVVGDWNGHGQVAGCSNDDCAASFNAGVDMFMVPEDFAALYENTLGQVRSGEIPMERLDDAVRRILRVKMRAGLWQAGKPSSRPLAGDADVVGSPEHRAVARQAVRESLVLLKNNGGLLPLSPGQRVLVAGDGADDLGKQCGGWTITWQGTGNQNSDFPGATSIWAGIRQTIESGGGTAVLSEGGDFEIKPDVAVVVFGEDPYAEFQGDLDTLRYHGSDVGLLKKLRTAGVPVVSVFLSGRPLWVNPELNASDAFVAAWLPGTEGGGVADVLFRKADGAVNHDFKGKLSYSWPRFVGQNVLNRHDTDYDPLFPYGYGLTYAETSDLGELSESLDTGGPAVSRKVYFAGGPVAPWQLYVGDEADWTVGADGAVTTTEGSENLVVRSIDHRVQEDGRSVRWSGDGDAQIYLQAADPVDVSRESNGDLALSFDLRVEEAPASSVTLRMDCVYPCSGALDVTEVLNGLPAGEWQTVRIRLRCFDEAGADMTKINTPFLIASHGPLALSFSDVKLTSLAEGEAICPEASSE